MGAFFPGAPLGRGKGCFDTEKYRVGRRGECGSVVGYLTLSLELMFIPKGKGGVWAEEQHWERIVVFSPRDLIIVRIPAVPRHQNSAHKSRTCFHSQVCLPSVICPGEVVTRDLDELMKS